MSKQPTGSYVDPMPIGWKGKEWRRIVGESYPLGLKVGVSRLHNPIG